jgi:hypothetical protein
VWIKTNLSVGDNTFTIVSNSSSVNGTNGSTIFIYINTFESGTTDFWYTTGRLSTNAGLSYDGSTALNISGNNYQTTRFYSSTFPTDYILTYYYRISTTGDNYLQSATDSSTCDNKGGIYQQGTVYANWRKRTGTSWADSGVSVCGVGVWCKYETYYHDGIVSNILVSNLTKGALIGNVSMTDAIANRGLCLDSGSWGTGNYLDNIYIRQYNNTMPQISCTGNVCTVSASQAYTNMQIPLTTNYTDNVTIIFGSTVPPDAEIVFLSQNPADITSTSKFGTPLNITYNYTNKSKMTLYFLNYTLKTSVSTCSYYLNGTCVQQNNTAYRLDLTSNYTIGDDNIVSYLPDENTVYPLRLNLNDSQMENNIHGSINLTSTSEIAGISLYNISNLAQYNFFEIMLNTTGNAEIYYCNNAYNFNNNPSTDTNCVLFAHENRTSFNHTHNLSNHNVYSLPINTSTGKIGLVNVTSTSYFLIKRVSGIVNIGVVGIPVRPDATRTSNNNGNTFTNRLLTIDAHVHQFGSTDTFNYMGCGNFSGVINCSSSKSDTLDLTNLPPSSPQINTPTTQNYQRFINITYTASNSPQGTAIQYYNISLLNSDLSFNTTIKANNTLNLSYYYDDYSTNLTPGTYYIKVVVKDANNNTATSISQSFNISTNAELNVTAIYYYTNQFISNYSLLVIDSVTGNITNLTTTSNKTTAYIVKGRNYTLFIDAPNYAPSNITGASYNATSQNYTFTLYAENSLLITIYDEATLTIINNTDVSITFDNNNTAYTYTTSNGTYYKTGLVDGSYQVKFYNANYSYRTYTVTVGNRSYQLLNAYLVPSTYTSIFTFYDSITLERLEGVSFLVERLSNGSYITVESKSSDISGAVSLGYLPGVEYRFTLSKSAYLSKVFNLNPVIFSSYNVYLDRSSSSITNTLDYGLVSIVYYPKTFLNQENNPVTFVFSSPYGELINYAVSIKAPGGSNSTSGSNAIGETFTLGLMIINASVLDRVNVSFNYTSTQGGFKHFYYEHEIIGAGVVGNYTIANIKNRDYGMGAFEKVLLVMFALVIICGSAYAVAGSSGAIVSALLTMGTGVYLGFLPLWSVIISFIIGITLLVAVGIGGQK